MVGSSRRVSPVCAVFASAADRPSACSTARSAGATGFRAEHVKRLKLSWGKYFICRPCVELNYVL